MTLNRRQTLAGIGSAALVGCAPTSAPASYDGDADIIILGAGLAGLRAAQILSDTGRNVIVLEANDRVGGRVYTLRHGDGYTEGGSARIRKTDTRVQSLAEALGLLLEPAFARPEDMALFAQGKGLLLSPEQTDSFMERPSLAFQPSATDLRIGGGAQRLPDAMANSLLNWPVLKTYIQSISVGDKEVSATDHTGRMWRSQKMLCTLPFGALRHLEIKPDMPSVQKTAIARLPYAQNLQIHFRAKSPFWETDGLPPDMWTDRAAGHIIANRDSAGNPTGLFHSTLYGDQISALYQDGAKGLHQRFRAELARLRPSTYAAIDVLDVVNWTKDNHAAGGAYVQNSTAEISDRINPIGDPMGGLHFAGAHLGVEANGMEGALESAERAAAALLA